LGIPLIWLRHKRISENDIFIASYPRSGSTWLRFLLFEILTDKTAEFETVNRVIPRPGRHVQAPYLLPEKGRLIQTHEPYRSEYHKAIYLVRDVKDVVVSEYFHQTGKGLYRKGFDDFLTAFLRGRVNSYGPWDHNVNSWLDAMSAKTCEVLIIKFENIRQNPEETLSKILRFLNTSVDVERIASAILNNSVSRMREKETRARKTVFRTWKDDSRFIRSGTAGGWHQMLTDNHLQLIEAQSRKALLRLGYQLINSSSVK
jgi:hypothetical protein